MKKRFEINEPTTTKVVRVDEYVLSLLLMMLLLSVHVFGSLSLSIKFLRASKESFISI